MNIKPSKELRNLKSHRLIKQIDGQRVFFCGDVHGDKAQLDKRLAKLNYVEGEDILIFAGDLIDRGNFSAEMIEFVCKTNNVYSVVGNHEQMFLDGLGDDQAKLFHMSPNNGGWWVEQYDEAYLKKLGEMIREHMSIALTVEYGEKTIGVTHAESPNNWSEVYDADMRVKGRLIWSQDEFLFGKLGRQYTCKGVDAVVHGHVNDYITVSGNNIWIDTVYETGSLTIISANKVLESVN